MALAVRADLAASMSAKSGVMRLLAPPLLMVALIASMAATGGQQPAKASADAGAKEPGRLPPGYLSRSELPNSLALLPPPPPMRSAAMQRDEEARRTILRLRNSPRYRLATADAVIGFPEIPNDFSCSVGFHISKEGTPQLYTMMSKMLVDVGLSTYGAKDHYKRVRPFVAHGTSTCYPKDEPLLRNDGSYPSGHSALGWGYALILAELVPSRADVILQRGRDFGQSRLVCDVHWQSDIDAGRVIAAATVARLHASPAFRSDLDAARSEVTAAQQSPVLPSADCAVEANALAAR